MNINKIAIVIALLAVAMAFFVNEMNLKSLNQANVQTRNLQTIQTSDDYSYLQPVRNLIETGSLYKSEIQKYNTIIRSPGYGLTHFVIAKVFGSENALHYQKLFQLLLFGLSSYCLLFIAFAALKSKSWAIVITCVYSLLPFSMGFLYYTLTEAITPALVIFYVYFLIKAHNNNSGLKTIFYVTASFIFGYLFLTRPVLGILGLALPFFIYRDYFSAERPLRVLKYLFMFGFMAISFMLVWQIRNVSVLGKMTPLHPIYQNELPGIFRPTHKALWDLFKGWESNGAAFHSTVGPLFYSAVAGDTSSHHIETAIRKIPEDVVRFFGENRLEETFKLYQLASYDQQPFYEKNLIMPTTPLPSELEVVKAINQLEHEFMNHFWFRYHITTPLEVFKNMIFHSNLSLYIFQVSGRGTFVVETVRWICFLIHVFAFILLPLIFITDVNKPHKLLFGVSVIIYLIYLAYFQRGIEERYTLPVLPLVLIGSATVVKQLLEGFGRKWETKPKKPI